MADYKTPGVYVEEISTLPPSAGQVPTAIPAFIGYTKKAEKNGKNLSKTPTFLSSLLDYKSYFGGAYEPEEIHVALNDDSSIKSVDFSKKYFMFDSMRMFFANGGGQCYVVSVGDYTSEIVYEDLLDGLNACRKEDLPTILVCPDAVLLAKKDECYSLQQEMLKQCNELQDRVAVFDIYNGFISREDEDVVLDFRNGIGVNFLKYGAAYYPWIQTTFSTNFGFHNINLKDKDGSDITLESLVADPTAIKNLKEVVGDIQAINEFIKNPFGDDISLSDKFFKVDEAKMNTKDELVHYVTLIKDLALKLSELHDGGKVINSSVKNELNSKMNSSSVFANIIKSLTACDLAMGIGLIKPEEDFKEFGLASVLPAPSVAVLENEGDKLKKAKGILKTLFEGMMEVFSSIKRDAMSIQEHYDKVVFDTNTIYQSIVNEVKKEGSKLPPSAAIAGVYAMVDFNRGVWKAPANVSLASTVKPWIKIDNDQQEDLNVDLTGGKSVNAIRAFMGQGTLIWGGRTLAGNDNEWRYISVRRFFNMVEKSLKLGTNWAVFEPNTEVTWLKVKAMMNNFLSNLWKAGALVGGSPADAFFVNVGLGSTMTQVDILEGKMNIEVGLAVVRPAEFIVIKFSHKFEIS
jgi:uncharacterized protein